MAMQCFGFILLTSHNPYHWQAYQFHIKDFLLEIEQWLKVLESFFFVCSGKIVRFFQLKTDLFLTGRDLSLSLGFPFALPDAQQ